MAFSVIRQADSPVQGTVTIRIGIRIEMTRTIIRQSNKLDEVRQLVSLGYCRIAVNDLSLTPGSSDDSEGVALSAYRDHFGARAKDKRFVLTGPANAGSLFAAASLMGELPHPLREEDFDWATPLQTISKTWDFSSLAETVDASCMNTDGRNPKGVDALGNRPFRQLLLKWHKRVPIVNDTLGLYHGVGAWREMCCQHTTLLDEISEDNYDHSEHPERARHPPEPRVLFIKDAVSKDFNKWYLSAPVVVAHWKGSNMVKISCSNRAIAKRLFGPGGLTNVFPELNEKLPGPRVKLHENDNNEWGGKTSYGGCPEFAPLSEDDARSAARIVANFLKERLVD